MKFNYLLLKPSVICMLCVFLGACGSGSSNDSTTPLDDDITDEPVNTAPVVVAGDDVSTSAGELVTLTAVVTDDDNVTISWSQTNGETVELTDSTARC
ncbi:hypothetical protein [Gilvimarinus polysaccharolyticus]|uniref:hypothetical protein n=1 Tax=Gilvimarinus polysaccharolyticus TaxID=863921 RepID=UPI0018DBB2B2|nr:hypothetical protein [Gilvimarinus polysaccharolyticus]